MTYKTASPRVGGLSHVSDDPLTPPFTVKTAVLVRDDLASWQRLNVTAFLTSGVTAAHPELVGAAYEDADGTGYLRLLGVPVVVLEATSDVLRAARRRALDRQLTVAIYTREMFSTGYDRANRAIVAEVAGDALDLVGIGMHGPKKALDAISKGARLHP